MNSRFYLISYIFLQLQREISQEFNLVDADVNVIVDDFIPGSTHAHVRISISDYYAISLGDITTKMSSLAENNFKIGKFPVVEVSGLVLQFGSFRLG